MKEFNIYSQKEGFKIVDTYINDKGIVAPIVKEDLLEFLRTLYEQGLFLGHKGDIIPNLSRELLLEDMTNKGEKK